jgi:hypothetical protein
MSSPSDATGLNISSRTVPGTSSPGGDARPHGTVRLDLLLDRVETRCQGVDLTCHTGSGEGTYVRYDQKAGPMLAEAYAEKGSRDARQQHQR